MSDAPNTLDAEFAAVEREILALAGGTVDRAALEQRVGRLCEAVLAHPPAEARALAPELERLIARLDATASEIQQRAGAGDSPAPPRTAGSAAAAYGASQNRSRRGF